MRSNYEPIGPYIRRVDLRNTEDKRNNLLGVSVSKVFMKSIANTIGTDFKTYRIVKRNQFTYIPDTSRRGDKIGIALLEALDEGLVSQAYTVFEIIDTTKLLPEYLMLWFRRPEFDRYARFISHGSVREIFEWDDMCNVSLPIPSITKQKQIVAEYNVIQNRIQLNQQLIQKHEETAQAIYKHWFMDYEFPISPDQAAAMGRPDLEGKRYKSSGGEMVESELGRIPKGWLVKTVGDFVDCNASILTTKDKFKSIEYLDTGSITNNEIQYLQTLSFETDEIPSRAKRKVSKNDIIFSTVRPNLRHFGIIKNPSQNMIVSTGFAVLKPIDPVVSAEFIYLSITRESNLETLQARAEMSVSTYPSINPEDILEIAIPHPDQDILLKAARIFNLEFELSDGLRRENKLLRGLDAILLCKLATIQD